MPRPSPRIPRTVPKPVRQPDPRSAPDHLRLVRQLSCVVTGLRPADPHHLLSLSLGRGMSYKVADRWVIPIHRSVHDVIHAAGRDEVYLAELGIDARAVAAALWAASGDLDAMQRIVDRARSGALLKQRSA